MLPLCHRGPLCASVGIACFPLFQSSVTVPTLYVTFFIRSLIACFPSVGIACIPSFQARKAGSLKSGQSVDEVLNKHEETCGRSLREKDECWSSMEQDIRTGEWMCG